MKYLVNDEIGTYPVAWKIEYTPTAVFRLKQVGPDSVLLEQRWNSVHAGLPENWIPVLYVPEET